MNSLCYLLFVVLATVLYTQSVIAAPHKGTPEIMDPIYGVDSSDAINKVQSELLNALDILQNYQEGASMTPLKLTEKRRNKFEFIRFGRKRR